MQPQRPYEGESELFPMGAVQARQPLKLLRRQLGEAEAPLLAGRTLRHLACNRLAAGEFRMPVEERNLLGALGLADAGHQLGIEIVDREIWPPGEGALGHPGRM